MPPTLGSGEPWTEGGMWGFHLLFINTGSGNTPHCQPNTLSLHLVPWQRGAAMTRYRTPDVPRMREGWGWMTGSSLQCSYKCTLMKAEWGELSVITYTEESNLSAFPSSPELCLLSLHLSNVVSCGFWPTFFLVFSSVKFQLKFNFFIVLYLLTSDIRLFIFLSHISVIMPP